MPRVKSSPALASHAQPWCVHQGAPPSPSFLPLLFAFLNALFLACTIKGVNEIDTFSKVLPFAILSREKYMAHVGVTVKRPTAPCGQWNYRTLTTMKAIGAVFFLTLVFLGMKEEKQRQHAMSTLVPLPSSLALSVRPLHPPEKNSSALVYFIEQSSGDFSPSSVVEVTSEASPYARNAQKIPILSLP
ncbi:hypothetical protein Agabi119p4_3317 [Agaricus bisporus var. burnettii]|uniref:Uncharacterized protein n=1 Tax=Agaricus bisporus var. burnettii TaxID=192524 RepID=A0A8H7KIZ7_AGABI|nr:hypothetical protein Agabi119p4_3317 [Agaricus bisporus var. burnettii]